ncbi:hypothetical protein LTR66_004077 [Elasticomyces elasticus]|nr:hypothetical protein LTR66_004077 [Elasticomyces elasticus]
MPAPVNTLLIEGSFEELTEELATYLDSINNAQGHQETTVHDDVSTLLQKEGDQKDEVLKKLVTASSILNSAPEREFIAAYNLLIHLVRQSENSSNFLPVICRNVSKPVTSSPNNGTGLALNILSTVFNTLPPDQDTRYHVLLAILRIIRTNATFDSLKPQLKHIDTWLEQWDMDKEEQRRLFLAIQDVAMEAGEDDAAYQYLVKALRTIQSGEEVSSTEAHDLSLRALRSALLNPSHFDFQDLIALDSIQALRTSEPVWFQLLEVFSADLLDDYNDFKDEHDGWVDEQGLDGTLLTRKMRLLSLASIAASSQNRTLAYNQIAKALLIPTDDVEMWVIDVIRAGLVEGKLSQQGQTFLIHRSTYRVFGQNQWREVGSRLDMWRTSLVEVLRVIRQEKEQFVREKEQELRDAEQRSGGMGYRPRQQQRQMVDSGFD